MKILSKFIKPYKGRVLMMFLLLLLQALGTLYIPTLMADIVNKGILAGDMGFIWKNSAVMLVAAMAVAGISTAHIYLSSDNGALLGRDIRNAVFRKTQELSIQDFNRFGTASMITRCTNDVMQIQNAFSMIVEMLLPAPFMLFAGLLLTFSKDRVLAFAVIGVMAVILFLAFLLSKKAIPMFDRLLRLMDEMNRGVLEKISGVRVIRAFNRTRQEKEKLDGAFTDYSKTGIRINRLFALLMPLITLIMNLSSLMIIGLGNLRIQSGGMLLGDLYAIIEYATIALTYLVMGLSAVVMIPRMNISARRIQEVLDAEASISANTALGEGGRLREACGDDVITFRNVTFRYCEAEKPVLDNINFSLRKGQTTAVVGGAGAGKTTLLNLLMRFFDPQEGQILAKGMDIRDLSVKQYRESIGYVPQKAFLFSGSIEDNLRHGGKDVPVEALSRAVQIAQLDGYLNTLEGGLQARVAQGGANFSGGQKQRLAIARAIAGKHSVYVFDDSFSALDYQTDANLRRELKKETADAAVLIVAQRISTILDADQIIVLEEGQIVGQGTHRELMECCSVYRQIAESQMKQEVSA